MKHSLKFKHIEDNLIKLFTLLYSNQNIAKYVYYLVDDPLSMPVVPVDLKENGNYILTIMDTAALTDEKIRIFLNPVSGGLKKFPADEISYEIDIVCPSSKWVLNDAGNLRPYRIMDEFSQMVDGQMVAGIGTVNITDFKASGISGTSYMCLSALIKVISSTMKGLR